MLTQKMEDKKKPILTMRDDIISGDLAGTTFDEMVPKFDASVPEL